MANASTLTPSDASPAPDARIAAGAASSLTGFSERTLARMANDGQLDVIKTPGGHRRYLASQIRALATGGAA